MLLDSLEPFSLVVSAILNNQNSAYYEIASIAVLVYDYILTLKSEIQVVWGTPWNIGKVLFFLTRYTVFIDAGLLGYFHLAGGGVDPIPTCSLIYQLSGWMLFVGTGIAQFVLIFRTWAVWGQSRKVGIGLIVFLFSLGIPAMYLTNLGEKSVDFIPSPVPVSQRCFIFKYNDKTTLSDYLVITAVETVILVLTIMKVMRYYKLSTRSSLVTTLYEDGVLYYVYLTVISIANIFVYAFTEQSRGASLILLQRVFHSIFTARILLHLRLAVLRDQNATGTTPPVLTTLISPSQRGQFSTIVLGTEVWCLSSQTTLSDASDAV